MRLDVRLCDDAGLISHERTATPNGFDPDLTYYKQFNNLRRNGGHEPFTGEPFACTGAAHLGPYVIRCTNPLHSAVVVAYWAGVLPDLPGGGS
jgi:hypothetical protein